MSVEEFITKAKEIYGEQYDYTSVNSIDKGRFLIRCKKHGAFFDDAHSHLSGIGCPECHKEKLKAMLEEQNKNS